VPRVSETYRVERRELILAAAARCFARSGFHMTSMDDVIAEAGLSAGAVYGYYKGKEELIEAAANRAMELVGAVLDDAVARAGSPAELLEAMLRTISGMQDRFGFDPTRIAVQAWGEAVRNPVVHRRLRQAYGEVRDRFAAAARRWQDAGQLPADADPDAVAQVLFGLIPGYIVQRQIFGDVRPERYAAALRALSAG
jgi:AcrR family transcriptional regulator